MIRGTVGEINKHSAGTLLLIGSVLSLALVSLIQVSCLKNSSESDSDLNSTQESKSVGYANSATELVIQSYGIAKLVQLAKDFDQGYALFVVTKDEIFPTDDQSSLTDFRIDWGSFQVIDFRRDSAGSRVSIQPGQIRFALDDTEIELAEFELLLDAGQRTVFSSESAVRIVN